MKKIILALVLVIFVAGCISEEKGVWELTEGADRISGEMGVPTAATETEEETIDRKVITTSRIEIEVNDFDKAMAKINTIIENYDGYIAGSSSQIEDNYKEGWVTLRIPEEYFSNVFEELQTLGKVKSTDINREDVTRRYIDLESRLNNKKAEEKRYLEILEEAKNVEEILKVESYLSRTREEIERVQGEINYLKNRVSYSTITVYLFEPKPISYEWGIKRAIEMGIQAFMAAIRAIIVGIFVLIPLVILSVVVYFVYKVLKKKTGFRIRK
ncbi:MAG: DUF4349 domain-containing protein [Methanomicrobia archaeon]|nr:DUF4349 domain-containing protein [Methanomicrobia archaeon]